MTIKQLGGVFGRNPTFNDVTIEGVLTFDGDIDINSDLKVDGDLDVTGTAIVENLGVNVSSITSGFRAEIYEPSNDGLNIQAGNAGAKKILSLGSAGTPDKIVFTAGGDIDMTAGGSILMKDGNGIDFSATAGTGTSELFDDYEEGTWTPTVATDGADGTYTVTVNTATYTKVGNSVRVSCFITVNITVAPTGALSVGGLPFNAAENTAFVDGHNSLSASTGQGYLASGSPIMRFNQAGSTSSVTMSAGTGNKFLMMSTVYRGA